MSVRGLNSSLQASPSSTQSLLNMTSNALTVYLRSSAYHPNMTSEELNMAFGDPTIPTIPKLDNDSIIVICAFIICCALGVFLAQFLEKHEIIQKIKLMLFTLTPIVWIKNTYVEMNRTEVLPMYRPKKAKESPFVAPMPMPQILPQCPRLEGAEKGQNLMFKLSVPYRRFQSSDNLPAEAEHRITITTTVERTAQPSKV